MTTFLTVWSAHIDAPSHEEAAATALDDMRRPDSIATIFEVTNLADDVLVVVDAAEGDILKDNRGEDYEYE